MTGLPDRAEQVQAVLEALGATCRVVVVPETTRTAEDAARALGCEIGQIAKTVVFRGTGSGKPVLVVASGANRVDERLLEGAVGEGLAKAKADFVRDSTGYAIGGVPPVGFPRPIETWIDEDLLQYPEVWAAAGTPNAVFCVDPSALVSMTAGMVTRVR
jgi:prolyl-tRNA editing enzyme YbaK/EbsC (Cys-tRNA(Pro) deacylase)